MLIGRDIPNSIIPNERAQSNMKKNRQSLILIVLLGGSLIFAGVATMARISEQKQLFQAQSEVAKVTEENVKLWRTVEALQDDLKASEEHLALRVSPTYRTVCSSNTWKSFESESAITNTSSAQYKLKLKATIETNFGFLWIDKKYILVAMAPQYGPVGSKYLITFESGQSINVMIGDIKQAECISPEDGSMIEVLVSLPAVPEYIRKAGNFDLVFRGSIKSIMEAE